MSNLSSVGKYFRPVIKLHWWRLQGSSHGNFGDEITKEIIETVYKRRVVWAPADSCDIIGAGSIIEEVTQNKATNRPYLWSSGFIQPGDLTISSDDYKILGVRGKESLKRIRGDTAHVNLGDAGLLASYLLEKTPKKQYALGILPHYVDAEHPFVQALAKSESVRIIDATWPCRQVVEEIAKCDAVLSSSLHGLIVSDSLGVPNIHLKLSDKLKGGPYKFNDYYSIYQADNRYIQKSTDELSGMDEISLRDLITQLYQPIPADELESIKTRLIESFPFR